MLELLNLRQRLSFPDLKFLAKTEAIKLDITHTRCDDSGSWVRIKRTLYVIILTLSHCSVDYSVVNPEQKWKILKLQSRFAFWGECT